MLHVRVVFLAALLTVVLALSASADISCRIFDEIKGHGARIGALAFSAHSSLLASGDDKGLVIVRDVDTERTVCALETKHRTITALVFSPDGRTLYCSGKDGILWTVRDIKLVGDQWLCSLCRQHPNQPIKAEPKSIYAP